jgi:hypothetical protein
MGEWKEQVLSQVLSRANTQQNQSSNVNSTVSTEEVVVDKESIRDKFNYASAECGSKVLSSNSGTNITVKCAYHVLRGHRDWCHFN